MDMELTATQLSLLITNGFLVFCMQAGFVVYETGHGRAKNVRNIVIKNFLCVMVSALAWWAVGYALAYGDTAAGILGTNHFFNNGDDNASGRPWFFTWTFALCTSTIVSGCLAERAVLQTYLVVTLAVSLFIHPVVAHWTWHPTSWIQRMQDCNFIDFAGGMAVHGVGGLMGLIGAISCGPRIGRFDADGTVRDIPGHNMSLTSIGAFLMWFGWLGFNGGTTFMYGDHSGHFINRVAVNVTLAAASAGLTAVMVRDMRKGVVELRTCCNGVLCGLVVGTAMAGYVMSWAACIGGALAGGLYPLTSNLLTRFKIDDPLDSSAVHLVSGLLGTLLLALLARPEFVRELNGTECGGALYKGPRPGMQIYLQILGPCAILAFTGICSVIMFRVLIHFHLLRVDQATELAGLDNIEHGGPAYPEFMSHPTYANHTSC